VLAIRLVPDWNNLDTLRGNLHARAKLWPRLARKPIADTEGEFL
jgi:hypothetical protein